MQTILSKTTAAILFLLSSLSITANTDPFSFTALTDATPNTFITSNIATITGFDSTVSIRIEGGSYIIGAGAPTSAEGAITAGATVAVRILSSSEFDTQTVATLTVGSGVSATRATFSVTTRLGPSTPVFTSTPITTTRANSPYQYNLSASDVDSSNLVFSAAPDAELPSWLAIDIIVTTLAGDGVSGDNNGASATARFRNPSGVAIDASGDIIVADTINHRIRNISPQGVVTTIAGSGLGFLDGASATAQFIFPNGVAIDALGNIIVADTSSNRIRRISTGGEVSTIAGSSESDFVDGASATARFSAPFGVAIDALSNIIVADENNHRIRSISTNGIVTTIAGSETGFVDGVGSTARFASPTGVAIDASGNIIVADRNNHSIRRITPGGTVSTIAGDGTLGFIDGASATARFYNPFGVAIDALGNIIVADRSNNRIRKITPDETVSTIAGGQSDFADGASAAARFSSPVGVAVDASGNIVVADRSNERIRKININNFALVGNPICDDIGIYNLELIVSDGELQDLQSFNIVVADNGDCDAIPTNLALSTTTISENILAGSVIATISADDNNPASLSFSIVGGADSASFSISSSNSNQLVINHNPNFEAQNSYEIIIAVSDVIHRTTKTFNIIVDNAPAFTSAPITRTLANSLYRYNLSASDSDSSNLVFSADPDTELPSWLTIVDTFVTTLAGSSFGDDDGPSATAQFNRPTDVAIDASGNIIIADRNNHRIRSIASDGTVTTIAGDGIAGFTNGASATAQFNNPTGITIDTSGNIIIADRDNHSIRSIDSDGMVSTVAGDGTFGSTNGASATAQFNTPTGVAIDASGNIVVADRTNNRIRSISPNGMVSTIAGNGLLAHNDGIGTAASFRSPTGIAINASGNIIVADRGNHRIRRIVHRTVSTIAGGNIGLVDGARLEARFDNPSGVAIDTSGNIIVADTLNHRIRSISPDDIVTTIAGSGPSGPDSGSFADGISSNARFSELFHIVIDASDNIIVADELNNRIRKIERNSFILVGTPSCSDVGSHNLELIVSDGRSQSLQNFNIFVADDGNCGTAPTNLALSTTTIDENILAFSIIATISADDSDNPGSLTFGIVGGADSANFRIDNGNQLVINQSPDFETQSSYEIIIGVSDILNPLVTTTFNIDVNQIIIDTTTNIVANSPYLRNLIGISTEGDRVGFSVAEGSNLPQWLALGSLLTRDNDNNSFAGQDFSGGTARPAFVDIDNDGDFDVFVGDFESLMFFENTGSSTTPSFSQANNPLNLDAINNDFAPAPAFVDIDNDGDFDAFVGTNFGTIVFAENTGSITAPTFLTTSNNPFGFRNVAGTAAPAFVDIDNDGDFDAFVGAVEGAGAISAISFFENTGSVSSPSFSQVSGASNPLNIVNIDDAFEYKPAFVDIDSDGDFDVFVGVDTGGVIFFENIGSATSALFTRGADFYDLLTAGDIDDGNQFSPSFVDIDGDGDNDVFVGRNIGAIADIVFYRNIPAVLTGTPECSDLGPDVLTLTINDGISTSGQSFDIRVISDGSCALVAPFNFGAISDVIPNTIITSNAITVATNTQDPQSAFTISIEGSGARYSINDGIYTNIGRIVNVGDSVRVQIVASNQVITTTTATVSIDNIAAAFAVTTADFMIAGGDRTVNYNSPPITITTTITDSPIVWSSNATNVISFNDPSIGLVTIVGAGTALISASRTGAEDSIVFTVEPLTLTPTFASPQSFIYNTNIRTVLVTITSGIIEGDDVSLSVSGATAADAGNYNIDLALIGTDSRNYFLSTTTLSWSIIRTDQSQFSLGADTTITFGDNFSRPATGVSATVASSYGSSNPDVATVAANGDITTTGIGSTIISTTNTGDNNYNSAADSYTLNVAPLTLTIAIGSTSTIYTGAAIAVTTTITNLVSGYEQVSLTISGSQTATNIGDYSFNISAIEGSDSSNYILIPITISWVVAPARQSELDITGNATILMVGQTTTATATNNQPQGTLTISASEAGIATINGSTITADNVGTITITISKQVANHNDISASYQLVVIQNTTTPIDAGNDRAATYTPDGVLSAQAPTNTQGRVISYAIDPIGSDVATININTGAITITNAGTVNILVSAAATTNYATSTNTYLLTINQAAQEPFTITASDTLIFGATSAIVVIDSGSGDGTITYDSSDIAIATITAAGIITAAGVGEAIITATRDGGRNYLNTSATHSLIIERADQTNFVINGSSTLANAATGFATATGGQGIGAITFSSSNPDIATISQGGVITAQSLGTTTISATKSGGDNYHDIGNSYLLTIVNTTPTVANPIPNQIASVGNPFTFIIPANTFNDADGDDLAISVSTLPDGLMFDSTNTSITGTPAILGISTITITANDDNGAMVSTSFNLIVIDDFIITGDNPRNVVYGAAAQNIIAQGGASPAGAITFTSSTPSVASFDDPSIGALTILGAGNAIITAARDGTGEQASISIIVSPRTITPTFASPQTFIYNTNIRTVLATITSGIVGTDDVSLSISGTATATDVDNYNIDLALIGAASRNYRLNTTTLSWSIIKADQSAFSLGTDTTITFGEGLSRPATGVSATVVSSYGSSDPDVAMVDINGNITTTGVGSTIISATNTGDNNYNSAADSYTLNVAQLTLTIATGSTTTIYTGAAITITTTITNLVSGYEQVSLTISGDQTATNAGDYSFDISAIEGSDSPNYILIPTTISWTIDPAEQSELDITSNATRLMVGQTTTATATNNQPQGTLTISASEAGIATIDGSTITATNVGTITITISKQVANHNDISASYQLVVIQNTTAAIDAGGDRVATYAPSGALSAQIPTNAQGRVISYAIDPIGSDVVTININTGAITITNAGTVSIVVSAAATTNYASSTDSYLLTINQAPQGPFTITASDTLIFGATSAIVVVDPGSGDGTITYAASPSDIITIDADGIISAIGVGEATITATKAGGRNYLNTSAIHSLIVERADQTNFVINGSSTLANAATSFATATGGQGIGAITFSSSNPDVATITQDGMITAQSLGTTTISAIKSGGDNYHDIGNSYLLTIINTTPTVANPIPNQIASVGNPFTFTIPANTFNDANGDTLTISVSALPPSLTFDGINNIAGIPATIGISTIIITADDGNGAMTSTNFNLEVTDRFIITGDNPRAAVYGAATQNIVAQGGATPTGAITFASSTPSIARFDNANIGALTIVGAGTTIITATRDSTNEQTTITFIIHPRIITPTFASPQTFIYNTNIRTVLATITSGIVGTDDVSLSISGTAAATNVGNYNIDLTLTGAASRNYRLSTTTLSWSIIKADQSQFSLGADTTITFGESLSRLATGVSATVDSIYDSSNPDVATVTASGDITTTGVGSTIISATNIGDNNYNSAADSYTLNVAPLTLTIAIGSTTTIYTGAAITITTTITNLVSGHEQVNLTISGSQTATNTGDYSFDISAIEGIDSPNYILIPITISWVVAPAQQSELDITGNATRLMVGQTTIATATNDQPQGTLTISASEAGIVTIDGSTITATNVGITTITISKQVANHNNISASYQLVVIQNTTTPIDAGDDRTATYTLGGVLSAQTPTNTQGRVISYAADPMDSDVATININTGAITITNAGTVIIVVSAAATTNYAASTDSYLLTINQANQGTFTITTSATLILGATSAIRVVDSGSGDGTITYSSSDIAIATITTDGIITATGAGEATITATKAGGRNYNDISTSASLEVVIVTGFNLDIDDDGRRLTTTDGILIIRFLTGSTDTIDTTGATTSDAQRNTQQILDFLQSGYDSLDVDGNGTIEANSDGMLIMRYLADQENLNTAGATTTTSVGVDTITLNLQNIYD